MLSLAVLRFLLLHLAIELVVARHAQHAVAAVHQRHERNTDILVDGPAVFTAHQGLKRQAASSSTSTSTSTSSLASPTSLTSSSSLTSTSSLSSTSTSNPSPSTPPFNPFGADNIAAYIGHTPGNFNASLPQLCADTDINIVILAFVRSFNGPNLLPTFDIAPSCDSRKVTNYAAPFACSSFASQVAQCQASGKKVFISIGGSSSNTTFASSQQAVDAANTMWNIFGAGTATPSLRPFGSVVLDGVDVDQEASPTMYYDVFAQTLRSLFATNANASNYYLSAAPLCANTSAILPTGFYQNAHFVFVRFYNAKVCNVGTKGFIPSMVAWRNYFASISGTGGLYPRLYIGALSFDNLNSGYVNGPTFQSFIRSAANATSDRFGGVMLWDGTNGEVRDAAGRNYIGYTKEALCTPPVSRRMAGAFLGKLWTMARNAAIG